MIIPLLKLWSPDWKIKETREDILAGKVSRTHAPIRVSRWGAKFYVIDGNHRVQEALQAGKKNIEAVLDEHVPNMNRTGGAYNNMLETAVRVDAKTNPITAAPGAEWAKKQLLIAERGLAEPDPQREILLDKHIWPEGYLHLVIYRIGPDWFRWALVERKPKKAKVVGTGDASRWHGRLEIGNSFITKPFRGYGLYPQILKELKAAAGVPLVSATSRSKAAEKSWKRMGGVKVENEDRYQLNPGRLVFVNPADVITTAEGYFVKKAALRKIQKAMYEKTGDWLDLDDVERAVNAMLVEARRRKFTLVHGKHFKQANPNPCGRKRARRG